MPDPLYGDALMQRMLADLEDDPKSPRRLGSDVDLALDLLDAKEMSPSLVTDWMADAGKKERCSDGDGDGDGGGDDAAALIVGMGSGALKFIDVTDPLREFWAVYTNGIRGELRDMFTILMSLKVRGLYVRLGEFQDDFRKWWEFFSKFAVQGVLLGLEGDVLRFVGDVVGDKRLYKGNKSIEEVKNKWREYRNEVGKVMENIRDYASEVDNVFVLLKSREEDTETCVKLVPFLYEKTERLTTPMLELLKMLDAGLERFIRGSQVPVRTLMQMHRAAVSSMIRESGLGWACLSALTEWMPSREMRRDFVGLHVRGVKKLGFLRASKGVHDKHYTIVDGFRRRATEFSY